MAHEIYYTSAPEGIRQGDRGFCTVAATPGIPRRLWDRLEALSGYRHHFDPGTRPAANPVCSAHWMLNVEGRDYHVLSRIYDAGLDYTQRTNALAHHLVLEPSELAPAGPVWMLTQSGVMLRHWDGRVGEIARAAPLPRGDLGPGVCGRWQVLCGDAGWTGVVAQTIATSPWKPICLLFSPDQAILPLVGEVIALLPPPLRWQATFNTYFTSLPGGVTCQWRCCLAGTPAAANAIRLASSGLIIDLTRPDAMGDVPVSPWVTAARNGQMGPRPAPAAPTTKGKLARLVSRPRSAPAVPTPPQPAEVKPFELAAQTPPPPALPVEMPVAAEAEELGAVPSQPEVSWGAEMRKLHRRRLMAIYVVACLGIAAGVWLQVWASRSSSNRPLPPVTRPPAPPTITAVPGEVHIEPAVPVPTPPRPPSATTVTPAPVAVPPAAVPVPAVPRPAPAPITLDSPLPAVGASGGLRDVTRVLSIAAGRFDDLEGVTSLSLRFPGKDRYFRFHSGDLDGVFAVSADGTRAAPGLLLEWRDSAGPAASTPIVSVVLDRTRPQLEFTWRTSVMLRRPQLVSLGYWVLQNSAVVVSDAGGLRPQSIEFAPLPLKATSLLDPQFDAAWPTDLPVAEQLSLGQVSPAGWQGTAAADAAAASPGKFPVQLLHMEKPLGKTGLTAKFTIRFSATGRLLETDLKQAIALATEAIAPADPQIKQAEEEAQKLRDALAPGTKELEQRLADWKQAQARNATKPEVGDLTPEQYREEIELVSKAIRERQAELDRVLAPLLAKKQDAVSRRDVCTQQLAAYEELKELELVVELPQGPRVGSVRLKRD